MYHPSIHPSIMYVLSVAVFVLQQQSQGVAIMTLCSRQPKIFAKWPSTEEKKKRERKKRKRNANLCFKPRCRCLPSFDHLNTTFVILTTFSCHLQYYLPNTFLQINQFSLNKFILQRNKNASGNQCQRQAIEGSCKSKCSTYKTIYRISAGCMSLVCFEDELTLI